MELLPTLSHIAFEILTFLYDRQARAGSEIRDYLTEKGIQRSRPAFYQLMGRLKAEKLVEDVSDDKKPHRYTLPPRVYRITDDGQRQYDAQIDYYLEADRKRKCKTMKASV